VGEHGLDRLNVLNAFGVSAGKASFEYRRIGESFRLIEDGLVPVIIPIEARPRDVFKLLCGGYLTAGSAARKLQSFIVPVPPKARNLLLASGHVRFVETGKFGDQFAELSTLSLYREEVGLLWENAEYLEVENTVI
jgi:CRISPR-associated endonuclease/helicase Cas3